MAPDIASPNLHAKRFGFADTQYGGSRLVVQRASRPSGLREMPALSRTTNSTKKK